MSSEKKPQMLQALEAAALELQRLRDVHLPHFEGKIGEPSLEVLNQVKKAIGKSTREPKRIQSQLI